MTVSARWLGIAGIILYLPTGWFYLTSGLIVPGPALLLLILIWIAGLALVIRTARTRPALSLLGVPLAVAFWFAYVSLGAALFGWTA